MTTPHDKALSAAVEAFGTGPDKYGTRCSVERAISTYLSSIGGIVCAREPAGYVTEVELAQLKFGVSCVDLFGTVAFKDFKLVPLHAPLSIAGKGDGWMPIETAPKDGTPILAIYQWQGKPRFMVIRRHLEHPWWMADHDSYIKHDDSKDTHRNFGFTHWRTLPASPSIQSDTEGGV